MSPVLCVDPDEEARATVREAIEGAGLSTRGAGSVAAAREAVDGVDCVVTEYGLPDGTGYDVIAAARGADPDVGCVFHTGADRAAVRREGSLVVDYVPKSAPVGRVASVVRSTVALRAGTAYPLPDDEDGRLAAVAEYDPSDERVRAALERLTDLVTTHFGVPIASVNALGARDQTFVVCRGASWDPIARRDSVCTYTVLEDEVTVVEDVREDPRFSRQRGPPGPRHPVLRGRARPDRRSGGRDAVCLRPRAPDARRRRAGRPPVVRRARRGPRRGPRRWWSGVSRARQAYAHGDLPLDPVAPGTTLLVSGPAMDGGRDVALSLSLASAGEGSVLVSTATAAERLLAEVEAVGPPGALERLAVVDCLGEAESGRVRTCSSPADLTGIGIEYAGLLESFRDRGVERVRLGLHTLSPLLQYNDFRTVSQFVHTLAGRVDEAGGFGALAVDPDAQDERTVAALAHFCDGRVDVRPAGDGHEVRLRGLPDRPGGWHAYSP